MKYLKCDEEYRKYVATFPLDMWEWMEKNHPEWIADYNERGSMVKVPEMLIAWGAWNAAIDACVRQLFESPMRELHENIISMRNVAAAYP